jgi:hypothetical protein
MSRARVRKDHADTMYSTIEAKEPIMEMTCPCCGHAGGCDVEIVQQLDEGRRRCRYECRHCGGEWMILWDGADQPTLEAGE